MLRFNLLCVVLAGALVQLVDAGSSTGGAQATTIMGARLPLACCLLLSILVSVAGRPFDGHAPYAYDHAESAPARRQLLTRHYDQPRPDEEALKQQIYAQQRENKRIREENKQTEKELGLILGLLSGAFALSGAVLGCFFRTVGGYYYENFVSAADHVKDIKESILDTEQSLAKAVAASPQNQEEIKEWQESLGISHGELARWEAKMQVQELIDLCTKRLSQLEKKIQSAEAENPTEAEELEKIATYKLRIPMWQQYLASHQSKLGIHVEPTTQAPPAMSPSQTMPASVPAAAPPPPIYTDAPPAQTPPPPPAPAPAPPAPAPAPPPPPAPAPPAPAPAPPPTSSTTQMTVTVPAGTVPGQQLQVQAPNGQSMIVTVPEGVFPGGQFMVGFDAEVPVPAAAPPPPTHTDAPPVQAPPPPAPAPAPAPPPSSMTQMTVTVPAGTVPGQQLQVQAPNGQSMIVTVPQGVFPGGQFGVMLPTA